MSETKINTDMINTASDAATKINSAPATTTQASLYQQLRSHLATLKLTTAAEQLPVGWTLQPATGCR